MVRLPDPGRSYAVLIGTSTYQSPELPNLPAVRNNLLGLVAALTDPAVSGFDRAKCTVVADSGALRTAYRTLRDHARRAEDTLLVYFAGHGFVGALRHELYLALPDTDPDELQVSALPFEVIREVLRDCPATNRVLILDCCFSGLAVRDHMTSPTAMVLGQVDVSGTYTLASTSTNATAVAPSGATYTAFTGELLTLLREGIPDGPELLTLGTIYPRLRLALTAKGLPAPTQRGTDTADLLALARNPVGRPTPASADGPDIPHGNGASISRTALLWSRVLLIIAIAIGVLGTALMVLLITIPDTPGTPQPRPKETTLPTRMVFPPNSSSAKPDPDALYVAEGWARAWVNHGVPLGDWLDGLRPYLTEELLAEVTAADHANVPADAVVGDPVVVESHIGIVTATVVTNGPRFHVMVVRFSDGWRVRYYEQMESRPVPVRVYNNSATAGLGARVAEDLRESGWEVVEIGNYSAGIIPTTTVYYRPNTEEEIAAKDLAQEFDIRVEPRFEGLGNAGLGNAPGLIVIVVPDYQSPRR
jgi:hypothetical protein